VSDRIASIDVLRAITMVLMIFVNDLGSLKNIPGWLEHVKPKVDGIGLADTVFPAFLFISGMSLPFAIANRRRKGDTNWALVLHVLTRTAALLVMGVFLVNGETLIAPASGMGCHIWNVLSCLAFIAIWNVYPMTLNKRAVYALKIAATVLLVWMAIVYRGSEDGGPVYRFAPQWWGILGLIGWAYLVSGLVTVFSRGNMSGLLTGWTVLAGLSLLYASGFGHDNWFSTLPEPIVGGTIAGFTMGGVVISSLFIHYQAPGQQSRTNKSLTITLVCISAFLIALSLYTHRFFILSKLGATPPWLFLCSAITIGAFLIIHYICDVKGHSSWFDFVRPAGTDTLLCYLIPYVLIAIMHYTHFKLPDVLTTGGLGLVKSFLFAMLCVFLTAKLNRAGIKLRL